MAYIILPHRWRRQPTQPVGIDWSNPLALGLTFAFDGATLRDAVTGVLATIVGSRSAGRLGLQYESANTSSQYLAFPLPASADLYKITTWSTICVLARVDAVVSWSTLLCVPYTTGWASPFASFSLQKNSSGGPLRFFGAKDSGASVIDFRPSTLDLAAGDLQLYGVSRNVENARFIKGRALENHASSLNASSAIDWNTKQPLVLLNRSSTATGEGVDGAVPFAAVWNRPLSDAELLEVGSAPYQIFRPLPRRIWVDLGAGGGPITGTLTRTLGALTSASAAALAIAGTSSRTLGALTSSSTAKVDIAGTSSVTLGAATLSSTGEIAAAVGTFDQTLGALTASSAAALAIAGTSSVTLGALTSASAAELSIAGTATPTLGALTSSGAAALAIDGTLTKTLGALTLSSDASIVSGLAGSADITLGALTSSAAAALSIAGSTSATLGALTSTAAGSVDIAATLGVTLGDITLSATGNTAQPLEATLTATLGAMTASCAGAVYTAGAVRPVSDTTPGAWLPSVGGDLYATIDEAIVDDADYDYTESASTMRLALGAMTDPGVNYGHAFTYRIKGDGSATLYARIGAGGTTVATYTHAPAPATLTTYRQVLSSGEVDTFRSNSGYTGGWIEFEAA